MDDLSRLPCRLCGAPIAWGQLCQECGEFIKSIPEEEEWIKDRLRKME